VSCGRTRAGPDHPLAREEWPTSIVRTIRGEKAPVETLRPSSPKLPESQLHFASIDAAALMTPLTPSLRPTAINLNH
jgi:hypothetical protein